MELDSGTLPDVMSMTGLQILQAIISGALPHPPMAGTLGFRLAAVAEGMSQFECLISPRLLNPFGTVHGGVALSLIDSAAGCAVHTSLPSGMGYASIETKVNFTRPLRHDSGLVTATGMIISSGKKIATAEAKLRTEAGELVAHGMSTILLLPNVKWTP